MTLGSGTPEQKDLKSGGVVKDKSNRCKGMLLNQLIKNQNHSLNQNLLRIKVVINLIMNTLLLLICKENY